MPAYFEQTKNNLLYQKVLSIENITLLEQELQKKLKNTHPLSIPIKVKRSVIEDVAKETLERIKSHNIGDMFSRSIQQREIQRCEWKYINERIMDYIKKEVETKIEQDYRFSTFSVWTAENAGEKNRYSQSTIKLNKEKVKSAGYENRF